MLLHRPRAEKGGIGACYTDSPACLPLLDSLVFVEGAVEGRGTLVRGAGEGESRCWVVEAL